MSEHPAKIIHRKGLGMLDAGVLLDFAAQHPHVRGDVEERIRRELEVTPARYLQLLCRAAASIEGQAHDAVTAHRVLRQLDATRHEITPRKAIRSPERDRY